MQETWPSDQSPDAVETKSPDEDGLVTKVAEDIVCVAERGERISS